MTASESKDEPMAQTVVEKVAAKAARIKQGGPATFSQLMSKPRRTSSFPFYTVDEKGEEIALQITYRALSQTEYDELLAEHPPSGKDRQQGAAYNQATFAPALISAVSVTPSMSVDQATEVYQSKDWAGGETATLFVNALRVCNAGLDVPFNAHD